MSWTPSLVEIHRPITHDGSVVIAFLSYASADLDFATWLAAHIGPDVEFEGLNSEDADLDAWRAKLAVCDALIVLIGADGLATSQRVLMQVIESDAQRRQALTIVPVLLKGAARELRAATPFLLNAVRWIE